MLAAGKERRVLFYIAADSGERDSGHCYQGARRRGVGSIAKSSRGLGRAEANWVSTNKPIGALADKLVLFLAPREILRKFVPKLRFVQFHTKHIIINLMSGVQVDSIMLSVALLEVVTSICNRSVGLSKSEGDGLNRRP